MNDQIPGEVLVPASRFKPKCKHNDPFFTFSIEDFDGSKILKPLIWCIVCKAAFEQELPTGVDGVAHGQV
jgi:hypothetical protein